MPCNIALDRGEQITILHYLNIPLNNYIIKALLKYPCLCQIFASFPSNPERRWRISTIGNPRIQKLQSGTITRNWTFLINRKASRGEGIARYAKQVLFRTTKQKLKKVYDRKLKHMVKRDAMTNKLWNIVVDMLDVWLLCYHAI